jgi:transposase
VDRHLRRQKHATRRLLWIEYRDVHPDGYEFSQFKRLLAEWQKSAGRGISMRQIDHAGHAGHAGHAVQVIAAPAEVQGRALVYGAGHLGSCRRKGKGQSRPRVQTRQAAVTPQIKVKAARFAWGRSSKATRTWSSKTCGSKWTSSSTGENIARRRTPDAERIVAR